MSGLSAPMGPSRPLKIQPHHCVYGIYSAQPLARLHNVANDAEMLGLHPFIARLSSHFYFSYSAAFSCLLPQDAIEDKPFFFRPYWCLPCLDKLTATKWHASNSRQVPAMRLLGKWSALYPSTNCVDLSCSWLPLARHMDDRNDVHLMYVDCERQNL